MEFKASIDGLQSIINVLDEKSLKQAINRTSNDEGRRFNTYATKSIKSEYNIKSSMVKSKTKIERAKGSNHSFILSVSSPRLDLSKFIVSTKSISVPIRTKKKSYMAKRQQVKVRVRRGKSKVIHGAFVANNNKLFMRKGEERLPIKKLSTISVTEMFRKDIVDKGFELVGKNYPKTFERNLSFYLGRSLKK